MLVAGFRQTGGSPHKYVLPQVKIYPPRHTRSCGVLVDFPEPQLHRDDTSSWAAIVAAGSLLMQACSVPGTGMVAGWALVGDGEYMRITIMDSRYIPRHLEQTGTGSNAVYAILDSAIKTSDPELAEG